MTPPPHNHARLFEGGGVKPDLSLLKAVLSLPTAPFHEEWVADFIKSFCRKLRLRCLEDSFGNLKVIYKRGPSKASAFTAHMDHPGFEVIHGGKKPVVRLLGGVPDHYFLKAKVILWDAEGSVKGRVAKIVNKKKREFVVHAQREMPKGAFGYFDLHGFRLQGGLIQTKAVDNVMSVAILLNLLKILKRKKVRAHVVCLFTRAEEVGFVGAAHLVRKNFLSKKIPTVVLESSSIKSGGVVIGGGPVLRVGDRYSTFSPAMDLWLRKAAEKLKNKKRSFQYQRALMQGGRCEASFYVEKGYTVGCLVFPLGNYHNIGPKSYAVEYISLKDYAGMLEWIFFLVSLKNIAR